MKIRNVGFIFCLLTASSAWSDTSDENVRAINIFNLTASDAQIWVSGVASTLSAVSGYQVPCYPGETLEVQYKDTLSNVACGDVLEIDYEH